MLTENTAKIPLSALPVGAHYSFLPESRSFYKLLRFEEDGTAVGEFHGRAGYGQVEQKGKLVGRDGLPTVPVLLDLIGADYEAGTLVHRIDPDNYPDGGYIMEVRSGAAGKGTVSGEVFIGGDVGEYSRYEKGQGVLADKALCLPYRPPVQVLFMSLHEFAQLRDEAEAHRRAARMARAEVQTIRTHIHRRNYGLAEDWCEELLGKLPHDHGAQEFYPLLDTARESL